MLWLECLITVLKVKSLKCVVQCTNTIQKFTASSVDCTDHMPTASLYTSEDLSSIEVLRCHELNQSSRSTLQDSLARSKARSTSSRLETLGKALFAPNAAVLFLRQLGRNGTQRKTRTRVSDIETLLNPQTFVRVSDSPPFTELSRCRL